VPRSIHADHDDAERPRSLGGRIVSVVRRHPRDLIGGAAAASAIAAIIVNALYLQPGPHPAPIFSVRARPVSSEATGSIVVLPRPRPADLFSAKADPAVSMRARTEVISDIQRELARRGFYEGPVDGLPGPRTDAAIQDFADAAGVKPIPEPSEELLRTLLKSTVKAARPGAARADPIGDLITPPARRVTAVQRALTEFGYGPLKATGVIGPDTRAAIEKFERERKLPITGQISDRLVRELSATTGRPLE
jgi:peptidoglycan hydrolase-like protein with peptidoglycan-binding domain